MKKLFKRLKENKKGFSLVELIVVIAIMAILVGVLGVTFIPYIERSREGMDIDSLGKVKSVVEPVMLTNENLADTYANKRFKLEDLREKFTIIDESLPDTVSADCTCDTDGEADLVCWVSIDDDGIVTAYFSDDADGAKAFEGTKSGDALTTGGAIAATEGTVEEPTTPATP